MKQSRTAAVMGFLAVLLAGFWTASPARAEEPDMAAIGKALSNPVSDV